MAYNLIKNRQRLIRTGAVATLVIVIAGGAFLLLERSDNAVPADQAPEATASVAPPTVQQRTTLPGDPVVLTDAESIQIRGFITEAHRQAADGNFSEAGAALQSADKLVAGLPETAQARKEIAEMATPQGRFATQLTRARLAIEHGDNTAVEKALAEAERLKPDAPEIAALRQSLQVEQAKQAHRSERIAALLATMHAAIARHDLAAAGSALNEAERIDIQDQSVHQARIELRRAQNAAQ